MPQFLENIIEQAKKNPALSLGIVAGTGVVLYLFYARKNTADSQPSGDITSSNADTLNGLDIASIAGIPYGYEWSTFKQPPGNTTQGDDDAGSTGTNNTVLTGKVNGSAILASTPGGTNNKGENIANIPGNTELILTGAENFNGKTYYKTSYNGKEGYVNSQSIKSMVSKTMAVGGSFLFDLLSDYSYSSNGHEYDYGNFI